MATGNPVSGISVHVDGPVVRYTFDAGELVPVHVAAIASVADSSAAFQVKAEPPVLPNALHELPSYLNALPVRVTMKAAPEL